jgi:hypothetical protein
VALLSNSGSLIIRALFALLVLCGAARAQIEDEPQPAAVTPVVPDVVLRAVGDRPVRLKRQDRTETRARILSVDRSTVVVALDPTQTVVAIPRAEIVEVQLLEAAAPPERARHAGIAASIAPGLALDVDYRLFYAFFNFDFVLPATFAGKFIAFAGGGGVNFRLGQRSRWKMEAFALVAPIEFNREWWVGLGAGIGFHWTSPSGFTVGIKLPILGYTATTDPFTKVAQRFQYFYMAAAAGLPVLAVGYRF